MTAVCMKFIQLHVATLEEYWYPRLWIVIKQRHISTSGKCAKNNNNMEHAQKLRY